MEPQLGRKHLTVFFTAVLLSCVCAGEEWEAVKATEGATVTLNIEETRSDNTQIVWTFGPENLSMRIATVKKGGAKGDYDERFRDRLQLDLLTGALTITQLRVTDSGFYTWQSISSHIFFQYFNLTVYRSISPPSIMINTSMIDTSCSSFTAECSVNNSRDLTLSWYRGRDRVKQTSSPDLSSRLSLSLQIDSYDGNNYSCVAENPVDEKTSDLQTEDTCLRNSESSTLCLTESTVRLVISALAGVVLIVLVVDHIRLRR